MDKVSLHKNNEKSWLTMPSCFIASAMILIWAFSASFASETTQRSFSSPEEAVRALITAVTENNEKELQAILGPRSSELIYSGDEVADRIGREKFLKAYNHMRELRKESGDTRKLYIGSDDWSMPIPIIKHGTGWIFDTEKGIKEILNRRIGRNELHVIEFLNAYVDAQHEYASKDCAGGGKVEFAQKLISTEGKRDGLYWEAKEGDEESPLGPLVAQAAKEGYSKERNLSPFHGYYFKILKEQGEKAKGGAYSYVVDGKMILGFAIVAFPAEYGNSGIMTFIVNQEGVIYEKDLGSNTAKAAEMTKYNPGKKWKKTEESINK